MTDDQAKELRDLDEEHRKLDQISIDAFDYWYNNNINKVRPITESEWKEFIKEYRNNGFNTTHDYTDRAFDNSLWRKSSPCHIWIALEDFTTPNLYGASSLIIVVPLGVKMINGRQGHTDIMYMKRELQEQYSYVPDYNFKPDWLLDINNWFKNIFK